MEANLRKKVFLILVGFVEQYSQIQALHVNHNSFLFMYSTAFISAELQRPILDKSAFKGILCWIIIQEISTGWNFTSVHDNFDLGDMCDSIKLEGHFLWVVAESFALPAIRSWHLDRRNRILCFLWTKWDHLIFYFVRHSSCWLSSTVPSVIPSQVKLGYNLLMFSKSIRCQQRLDANSIESQSQGVIWLKLADLFASYIYELY